MAGSTFQYVGLILRDIGVAAAEIGYAATAAIKAGVHGVVGGALSVAQGGNFAEGFAGSAIGALGGVLAGGTPYSNGLTPGHYGDGTFANQIGRAAISAAAGCGGAILSGGKCANGAITAAFASLYIGEGPIGGPSSDEPWYSRINQQHDRGVNQAIHQYVSNGFTVPAQEVRVIVPGFKWPRIDDFIAITGNNIFGVEVKTTIGDSITLDARQVAKDIVVVTQGGTISSGAYEGRSVRGVSYAETCFGCQSLSANSNTLRQTLRASGISINRCDTGTACAIGGK